MKFKQNKPSLDPRYFLNETAQDDTSEPSLIKEDLEVVLTDPEAKEFFGDDVFEGQELNEAPWWLSTGWVDPGVGGADSSGKQLPRNVRVTQGIPTGEPSIGLRREGTIPGMEKWHYVGTRESAPHAVYAVEGTEPKHRVLELKGRGTDEPWTKVGDRDMLKEVKARVAQHVKEQSADDESIKEGESHEDHPGRSCEQAHPTTTHDAWIHLELLEDIDKVLSGE